MQRLLASGAVWAYQFGDLSDMRSRYMVTGAPTINNSPFGKVLTLDGANDYVTLSPQEEYSLRFDAGTQDFSVMAWARRTVSGANHFILDKRDANGDGWRFSFSGDNRVYVLLNAVVFSSAPADAITDVLWHHIAFTVDRDGNGIIYLDGTASGTPTAIGGEVMATTTAPRIGAVSYDASSKFQGELRDLSAWLRVLTATEVTNAASSRGIFG